MGSTRCLSTNIQSGNDDDGGVDIDVIERANTDKISGCLYCGVFCGRFLCLALVLGVFWAILDGFKFVSFLGWVCVWFQKSVCVRLGGVQTARDCCIHLYIYTLFTR